MRYITSYIIPITVVFAFLSEGWLTFVPLIFSFGLLPLLEFILGKNEKNLSPEESEKAEKNRGYDFIIYSTVFIHFTLLIWFLFLVKKEEMSTATAVGRTIAMGLMCGVYGINVAHELGHRVRGYERMMSKALLTTSLYLHFYIEHNRGHHRNVGTPEDPATARYGETLYAFWVRTIIGSWRHAWEIVAKERKRKKKTEYSFGNEMLQYQLLQIAFLLAVFFVFGWKALLLYWAAAIFGILLLETVNYVEHYGLMRGRLNEFRYEDVTPTHSWNSDYAIGRLVLFELTRHSDHHTTPHKHYQLLDTTPDASELPAGYPAMMLLAMVPPLWFKVMNPRLPTP